MRRSGFPSPPVSPHTDDSEVGQRIDSVAEERRKRNTTASGEFILVLKASA
jgi:hypothetical protein